MNKYFFNCIFVKYYIALILENIIKKFINSIIYYDLCPGSEVRRNKNKNNIQGKIRYLFIGFLVIALNNNSKYLINLKFMSNPLTKYQLNNLMIFISWDFWELESLIFKKLLKCGMTSLIGELKIISIIIMYSFRYSEI